MAVKGKHLHKKGQTLVELVFCIPLFLLLILVLYKAFVIIHVANIHQRETVRNLETRLSNHPRFDYDLIGDTGGAKHFHPPDKTGAFSVEMLKSASSTNFKSDQPTRDLNILIGRQSLEGSRDLRILNAAGVCRDTCKPK